MATLDQLAYNILNIAQGGRITDDSRPLLRQIKFWVASYRSLLIKQEHDKGKTLDSSILQDLGCVPMILVDSAECCEITTCERVLRTKNPLPQPLDFNFNEAFVYIGTIDKSIPFQKIPITQIPFFKYDKYISKLPKWYYKNNHLYVLNNDELDYIKVIGVFENPEEVSKYTHCGTQLPCYDINSDYPLANYMIPSINSLILEKELKYMKNIKEDTTNDSQN